MAEVAEIKDIILTSTNVTASSYSEYDYTGSTTYNQDDYIKVSYESDGTTLRYPVEEYKVIATTTTEYPPDSSDWSLQGASNQWKMFDGSTSSQTTHTGDIVIVLDTSDTNVVGLFNLEATGLSFEFTAEGEVIQEDEVSLVSLTSADYYSYFFDDLDYSTKYLYYYPTYGASSLTITISGVNTACGLCVYGKSVQLGITEYNTSDGIIDYSIITTDSIGRSTLSQGNYADKAEVTFFMEDPSLVEGVKRKLTKLRGVPAIWNLNNRDMDTQFNENFEIYGYYSKFSNSIESFGEMSCSITVNGLA